MTDPHNEFFIEKEHLPVEVIMVTGEELRGSLFVQPSWRRPSIEFDVPVLLNLPDAYFPLLLADGTTRLIAKGHVVLIRGSSAESSGEGMGDPAPVAIRCSNGTVLRGKLMLTRVTSNVRVLDFLNRSAEEFILLHERGTIVLVNRRHVVLVQDESNGTN
jgi:small nuclear ribonucleoprotein (snRNP)-like protein